VNGQRMAIDLILSKCLLSPKEEVQSLNFVLLPALTMGFLQAGVLTSVCFFLGNIIASVIV
jgi:hypothetical protein